MPLEPVGVDDPEEGFALGVVEREESLDEPRPNLPIPSPSATGDSMERVDATFRAVS